MIVIDKPSGNNDNQRIGTCLIQAKIYCVNKPSVTTQPSFTSQLNIMTILQKPNYGCHDSISVRVATGSLIVL